MDKKLIPLNEVMQVLENAGIQKELWVKSFLPQEGLTQLDLSIYVKAIKTTGPESLPNFWKSIEKIHLIGKYSYLNGENKLPQRALLFTRTFWPALSQIIRTPQLRKGDNELVLAAFNEYPFHCSIQLMKKDRPKKHSAGWFPVWRYKFSFNVGFTAQGKPQILLGNFQVGIKSKVNELEKESKIGRLPEFLIRRFAKVFTSKRFLVSAANTRLHLGYQIPNHWVVAKNLVTKKKITPEEYKEYSMSKDYVDDMERMRAGENKHPKTMFIKDVAGTKSTPVSRKVAQAIAEEVHRIQLNGTVAHKIAYKKAGFRIKEKVHRIIGLNPDGSPISIPTKTKTPYWRLDPRRQKKH